MLSQIEKKLLQSCFLIFYFFYDYSIYNRYLTIVNITAFICLPLALFFFNAPMRINRYALVQFNKLTIFNFLIITFCILVTLTKYDFENLKLIKNIYLDFISFILFYRFSKQYFNETKFALFILTIFNFLYGVSNFSAGHILSKYTNLNDLSVVSAYILLIIANSGYYSKYDFITLILSFLLILLSGSKICFLIAIIVIIYIIVRDGLHRLNNFSIIGYLFSIAIFATVLLNGIFNNEIYQKYFYAIYRITSITAYTVSNGFDLNSSAYLRFQTYSYFIKNYNKFLMGDFKWGEKFSQFDKATFNTDLMALNPHSFLIELHCLFGIFAAILFGIWIFKMYIFLRNYSSQSKATSIIIIIFMLTNVTSSTITFWPIFGLIPIFLNSQKYFTGGEVAREN